MKIHNRLDFLLATQMQVVSRGVAFSRKNLIGQTSRVQDESSIILYNFPGAEKKSIYLQKVNCGNFYECTSIDDLKDITHGLLKTHFQEFLKI